MTMEKYGISTEELLKELKAEYTKHKETESSLIKTGSSTVDIQKSLKAIQAKIDELQIQLDSDKK